MAALMSHFCPLDGSIGAMHMYGKEGGSLTNTSLLMCTLLYKSTPFLVWGKWVGQLNQYCLKYWL